MKSLIDKALEETGLDFFYLKRPRSVFPCIVYSYNELPNASGDNTDESSRYDIFLNLIIKSNLTETTEKIKEVMRKHKFMKVVINTPVIFEDVDYYQITMQYLKTKAI